MNRSRTVLPWPRLRLNVWLVGVLALSSAALTVWALTAYAEAPASAAPATHSDLHYAFLGYADLEQGVTPLYPLQPGRVVQVFVHDGDKVDADAPLFALDAKAAQDRVDEAEADLSDAKLQLDQANKLPEQHEAELDAQRQLVDARKQEAAAAHAKADEAKRLNQSETKAVSDEDARAAEAQAKAADAATAGEEAKLRLLDLNDPTIGVHRAENAVKAKEAQLKKAQLGLRECTVRAPVKGRVERVQLGVGETLGPNPQAPALMFAADGPRIIRTEVEQEWADHVALNQSASVQDFSGNGPTWHGRVTRISDWYSHRRSIMMEPLQFNDVRTLECIVSLDPGQPPLRIGQRVRVTLDGGS